MLGLGTNSKAAPPMASSTRQGRRARRGRARAESTGEQTAMSAMAAPAARWGAHLILFQHLVLPERLHRIDLPRVDLLHHADLRVGRRAEGAWRARGSAMARWPTQRGRTHLSERTLANDLHRPEVIHPELRPTQSQKSRLPLPQLLQLALLTLLRHRGVSGELPLELHPPLRTVNRLLLWLDCRGARTFGSSRWPPLPRPCNSARA